MQSADDQCSRSLPRTGLRMIRQILLHLASLHGLVFQKNDGELPFHTRETASCFFDVLFRVVESLLLNGQSDGLGVEAEEEEISDAARILHRLVTNSCLDARILCRLPSSTQMLAELTRLTKLLLCARGSDFVSSNCRPDPEILSNAVLSLLAAWAHISEQLLGDLDGSSKHFPGAPLKKGEIVPFRQAVCEIFETYFRSRLALVEAYVKRMREKGFPQKMFIPKYDGISGGSELGRVELTAAAQLAWLNPEHALALLKFHISSMSDELHGCTSSLVANPQDQTLRWNQDIIQEKLCFSIHLLGLIVVTNHGKNRGYKEDLDKYTSYIVPLPLSKLGDPDQTCAVPNLQPPEESDPIFSTCTAVFRCMEHENVYIKNQTPNYSHRLMLRIIWFLKRWTAVYLAYHTADGLCPSQRISNPRSPLGSKMLDFILEKCFLYLTSPQLPGLLPASQSEAEHLAIWAETCDLLHCLINTPSVATLLLNSAAWMRTVSAYAAANSPLSHLPSSILGRLVTAICQVCVTSSLLTPHDVDVWSEEKESSGEFISPDELLRSIIDSINQAVQPLICRAKENLKMFLALEGRGVLQKNSNYTALGDANEDAIGLLNMVELLQGIACTTGELTCRMFSGGLFCHLNVLLELIEILSRCLVARRLQLSLPFPTNPGAEVSRQSGPYGRYFLGFQLVQYSTPYEYDDHHDDHHYAR